MRPAAEEPILRGFVVVGTLLCVLVAGLVIPEQNGDAFGQSPIHELSERCGILRSTLWMSSGMLVAGCLEIGALYDWSARAASYAYNDPVLATMSMRLAVPFAFGVFFTALMCAMYVCPFMVLRREALAAAGRATGDGSLVTRRKWLAEHDIDIYSLRMVLEAAAIVAPALSGLLAEVLKGAMRGS
jgi:hypothetical protein